MTNHMLRLLSIRGLTALAILLIVLFTSVGWIIELLWFRNVEYEGVFWRLLFVRVGLFGATFAVVGLYFLADLLFRNCSPPCCHGRPN